jgi:hypothetical protein
MNGLTKVQMWVDQVSSGQHETVKPGMPTRFTEASTVNDRICQGDLNITIADKIPNGYVKMDKPSKQLVFGESEGARHCLDSLDGVTMYADPNWDIESLNGPHIRLEKERVIEHPKHGNVTIPKGFSCDISYPKELDVELRKERRARD